MRSALDRDPAVLVDELELVVDFVLAELVDARAVADRPRAIARNLSA